MGVGSSHEGRFGQPHYRSLTPSSQEDTSRSWANGRDRVRAWSGVASNPRQPRGLRHYRRLVQWRLVGQPLWRFWRRSATLTISDQALMARHGFEGSADDFVAAFLDHVRRRFFFSPEDREQMAARLTKLLDVNAVVDDAMQVVENVVDVLGSGRVALGPKIDWQRDFKSGRSWEQAFYADIDYVNAGASSDVKVAWELSRFHSVAWLGRAFWMTGDARYADKFCRLVDDWIHDNPFAYGVNWAVAMEVAIRACNWIMGIGFFMDAESIPRRWWLTLARSLYLHGVFIRYNLEYGRRPNNHYIADGAGLLFLGVLFRDTPAGRGWLRLGTAILEEEMAHQVHPDGVHYEKSLSYHRLVLEFFYVSYVLGARNRVHFSPAFVDRLERMFEFTAWCTKPDGRTPLVGDADNGRLFRFSPSEDFNDHRGALAVGAVLFKRGDLKRASDGLREDALWLLGPDVGTRYDLISEAATDLGPRAFRAGGYYVLRADGCHMLFDAGDIGLDGWGGHGHNDTLSFELAAGGETFITDSGTYAYTGDGAAQVALASTGAHNGIQVDGEEVAEWRRMWRLAADGTRPRLLEFCADGPRQIIDAEHYGYTRLSAPVVHRRRACFWPGEGRWSIEDTLRGRGDHTCELFLHVAPSIKVRLDDPRTARLQGQRVTLLVTCDGDLELREGWVAPHYGVRHRSSVLVVRKQGPVPMTFVTLLRLEGPGDSSADTVRRPA